MHKQSQDWLGVQYPLKTPKTLHVTSSSLSLIQFLEKRKKKKYIYIYNSRPTLMSTFLISVLCEF